MNDESDDSIINFLEYSINHLENRINLLDNRASILIAVLGMYSVFFTYIIKEIFLTDAPSYINSLSYKLIGVSVIILFITVLLLIQTIRPNGFFFSFGKSYKKMNVENYIFWPSKEFPTTPGKYKENIRKLNIQENYENAHFIYLQLIRNKYQFYKIAVFFMKLFIFWSLITSICLIFAKWRIA